MNRSIISTAAVALAFSICAASVLASEPTQAQLRSQAKITETNARATALAMVPSGTIASSELENEHNRLIWSFDISSPGTKNITEIQVDAKTGKIVSNTQETPGKEADETAAEAKQQSN